MTGNGEMEYEMSAPTGTCMIFCETNYPDKNKTKSGITNQRSNGAISQVYPFSKNNFALIFLVIPIFSVKKFHL